MPCLYLVVPRLSPHLRTEILNRLLLLPSTLAPKSAGALKRRHAPENGGRSVTERRATAGER